MVDVRILYHFPAPLTKNVLQGWIKKMEYYHGRAGELAIVSPIECDRHHNLKKYSRSILPVQKVCKPCFNIIKGVL